MMRADPATIWTIGHSTHTLEEFLGLLAEYRIECIADRLKLRGTEVIHILDATHARGIPSITDTDAPGLR